MVRVGATKELKATFLVINTGYASHPYFYSIIFWAIKTTFFIESVDSISRDEPDSP